VRCTSSKQLRAFSRTLTALQGGPIRAGALVVALFVAPNYKTQIKVRLESIDAPESKQALGKRSQQSLAQRCAAKTATVREKGKDRYGRALGWVVCDGVDANTEQVRLGMAWVFVKYAASNSPRTASRLPPRISVSDYGQTRTQWHLGLGAINGARSGSNDSLQRPAALACTVLLDWLRHSSSSRLLGVEAPLGRANARPFFCATQRSACPSTQRLP
jgi:hypothetical protein